MSGSRSDRKAKAKWCECAERYDDMVQEIKQLIQESSSVDKPLDEEERNLLSVAYKNVVGSRRSAWRVVSAKVGDEKNEKHKQLAETMKKRIEDELTGLCEEVIGLLNEKLIKSPENVQAKIFFLKMKGDYHRYMVEICGENANHDDLSKNAESAYQEAFEVAKEKLPTTSPIRLGLALNYSVFFYEIKNSQKEACVLAKSAFDDAISDLEGVADDVYKDSTLIMQLLRDNLTLWTSEREDEEEEQDD